MIKVRYEGRGVVEFSNHYKIKFYYHQLRINITTFSFLFFFLIIINNYELRRTTEHPQTTHTHNALLSFCFVFFNFQHQLLYTQHDLIIIINNNTQHTAPRIIYYCTILKIKIIKKTKSKKIQKNFQVYNFLYLVLV